eukprot:GHVU01183960.1.p1 GENE.GHVU01183960.1~~GHVU01183960.1.p1  ORF type:complete len:661 (+),score=73.55 GHVU01183960.1:283-1983(+)
MGDRVLHTILQRRKDIKYYSVCVDHTRDVSRVDQLAVLIRYVENRKAVERFLTYLPATGHTGDEIFTALTDYLTEVEIDTQECRGQSYDTASNMSGRFQGVQTRMQEINPSATYVPCSNHGLNLDAQRATSNSPHAAAYFDTVQGLYVFFSASTARWQRLRTRLVEATVERNTATPTNPGQPGNVAEDEMESVEESEDANPGEDVAGEDVAGEDDDAGDAQSRSSSGSDEGRRGARGRQRVANRGGRSQRPHKRQRVLMPKSHAATRWSTQEASVTLQMMYNDRELDGETRAVAGGYFDALAKQETAFMTCFWSRLLRHINAATIALQKPQRTLNEMVSVYAKLVRRVETTQRKFDSLEAAAMELCGTTECVSRRQAAVQHNSNRDPLDYGRAASAILTARQRFRVEGFVRATDVTAEGSVGRIHRVWGFLRELPSSADKDLRAAAQRLREAYPRDFDACLADEAIQFRDFILFIVDEKESDVSPEQFMYDQLLEHELCTTFPNMHNALTIFLSLMVSNASAERSFSTLKRIKSYDRNSTGQARLVSLTRMFIESDILRQLDFTDT